MHVSGTGKKAHSVLGQDIRLIVPEFYRFVADIFKRR